MHTIEQQIKRIWGDGMEWEGKSFSHTSIQLNERKPRSSGCEGSATSKTFGSYSGGCRGHWPNGEGKAPGDLRKPGAESTGFASSPLCSDCAKTREVREAKISTLDEGTNRNDEERLRLASGHLRFCRDDPNSSREAVQDAVKRGDALLIAARSLKTTA